MVARTSPANPGDFLDGGDGLVVASRREQIDGCALEAESCDDSFRGDLEDLGEVLARVHEHDDPMEVTQRGDFGAGSGLMGLSGDRTLMGHSGGASGHDGPDELYRHPPHAT